MTSDTRNALNFEYPLSGYAIFPPVVYSLARYAKGASKGGRATDRLGGNINQFGGMVHETHPTPSGYVSKLPIYKDVNVLSSGQNQAMVDKSRPPQRPSPEQVPDPDKQDSVSSFLAAILDQVPNLTPAALGRAMGARRQDMHGYLHEGKVPKAEKLRLLANWSGASYERLLTLANGPRIKRMTLESFSTANVESKIIDNYAKMTDSAKKVFEQLSESLEKKHE